MTTPDHDRNVPDSRPPALLGALVADAAALGLHWLYEPEQIVSIEDTGELLFREPDRHHYDGRKGYFAHAGRHAGMGSQYGEHLALVARSIDAEGDYDPRAHQVAFLAHFGPGGPYVGYADRPTKALIRSLLADHDIPLDSGIDDDQMPVFAPLVAAQSAGLSRQSALSAVRVLSTNTEAEAGALALFEVLESLVDPVARDSGSRSAMLDDVARSVPGELGTRLLEALSFDGYRPAEVADRFGLPCHVRQGLPIVFHLAQHMDDYESVIRDNVRIGGDSCGRAIALGAIAGTVFGVPESLARQLA